MSGHSIGRFLRALFSWRSLLKIIIVLFVGVYALLWYISNYPNIPAYSEITEYRFLNPGKEKECINPEPINDNPDDPNNDIMIPRYQGWCNEERQTYYRTPQGTDFFGLQYDWIAALEKPVGKKPLITREYMQRLGYIYDPLKKPNADNPDDLPVGLTWHYDQDSGAKILDVSCAATYQGTSLVIDGGAGGHALPSLAPTQFMANSVLSLLVTYINPLKFNRFAKQSCTLSNH